MDGIKIDVIGNVAKVIKKPSRITSGTIGLPVEFSFDSQWDLLRKVAVFRCGCLIKSVDDPESGITVPWELLVAPGPMLCIGVYGINSEGTIAIPTIWANVNPVVPGADPDGDPSTDPTLPVWQEMMNYYSTLAIKPSARVAEIVLPANAWTGRVGNYSQPVLIGGVTSYSRVDINPTADQLEELYNLGVTLVAENDNSNVTVYAIGDKPTKDYTLQVSITEVVL